MKKIYSFFLVTGLLFVFTTCNKKDDDPKPNQDPIPAKPLVYQENAVKVSALTTSSTTEDIHNGTMVITDATLLETITPGSVLYSNEGDGYLVKVSNVSGSTLTVEPAALDELFKDGNLVFSNADAGNPQRLSSYNFPVSAQLINEGGMTLDVSGNINFNPVISGDISFFDKTMNVSMQNAPITTTLAMVVHATPDATLNIHKEVLLGELTAPATLYGVNMNFTVRLIDRITVTGTADINQTLTYTQNDVVSASIAYNNGWTGSFNLENQGHNLDFESNFKTTLQIRHEIIPYVEVKFYNVAGPYIMAIPYNNYNFKGYVDYQGDVLWNFNAQYGADGEIGVSTRIFKDLSYSKPFTIIPATEFYAAPKKIEIVDGNNQIGTIGQPLPKALSVKVLDSEDNELAGAMVHFEITEGTGVLSKQKVFTNASGIATTNLTVSTGENIEVKAIIKTADGENNEITSTVFAVNGFKKMLISKSPWTVTSYSENSKNQMSFNNTDTIKCSANPQDTMVYYNKERMKSGSITFGDGAGSFTKLYEVHDFNAGQCGVLVNSDKQRGETYSPWTYDAATSQITTQNGVYNVSYSNNILTLSGTKTVDNKVIPVYIQATGKP